MKTGILTSVATGILVIAAQASAADLPPLKIGVITSYTGPAAQLVKEVDIPIQLYLQQHGDTVAGRKIQIIRKDTGGMAPNVAKQRATELAVQDHVDFITGIDYTPNAIAIGQVSTEAKIPTIASSTLGVNVLTNAPYMVRLFGTVPQTMVPTAEWMAKQGIKKVFLAVADYGPGKDTLEWFSKAFIGAGGTIVGTLPIGVNTIDFTPEMQHIRDIKPDAVFVWLPSGAMTSVFIKQFHDAALAKIGITLYSDGDLTDDAGLPQLGDEALGLVTTYQYSYAHDSDLNRAFAKGFIALSGGMRPDGIGVATYDAMAIIYKAVEAQGGKLDPDKTMAIFRGLKFESPRGMVEIDPQARDLVQDIYVRRVERRDGELVNVEFDRIPQVLPVPALAPAQH